MACGAEPVIGNVFQAPVGVTATMARAIVTRADAAILLRQSPPGPDMARRGVLRLPISGAPRRITAEALARKAGLMGPQPVATTFSLRYLAPRRTGTCVAAKRAIAAGSDVHPDQLVPAPCDGAASGAIRYDRITARALATRPVPAGVRLGRLTPSALHRIAAGDSLTLRSTVGRVTIDRQAMALQSGDSGGRIFVRAGMGPAFAVPLAGGTGEGR